MRFTVPCAPVRQRAEWEMSRSDDADGRKIFVGGLPAEATERMMHRDFGKFGEIKDVYLPRDATTEKLRGFGFVTYVHAADARDAADEMGGCAHRLPLDRVAASNRTRH